MSDLNVATIMGRMVRDPIFREGRSRMAFFTLACNQRYRDDAGVLQEETAFVACKTFGAWADAAVGRHQGDTMVISGRLRSESWEKNGVKRTQLVLIGNALHAVGSAGRSAGGVRQPEPVGVGADAGQATAADQESPPF